MSEKTAINPKREDNFPEWYQQVIKAADMAENSPVRGCMVIKPWGYGIWEQLKKTLDRDIKETGHENAYFPLFIPLSFLEKEAGHVDGFAKECAVVTHHRLEERDGKLVPAGKLEEPLVVRPTSETIIGESFAKWIQSYRDLPLLINQWANVVRWEMRPRIFLRTAEFLWQEGHTAHSTESEAMDEMNLALSMYQRFIEEELAIPVIPGEKSEGERFPGAVMTTTVEAMMQDRKALQAGTSHYLGQNFAKSANIQFLNEEGTHEHAYTTSWGVSTRLIGGLIMAHSDDNGLRVPPRVAPQHIVILPVTPKEDSKAAVLEAAEKIKKELSTVHYNNEPLRIKIDARDIRGGEKNWQWIKKGIPVRIAIGPRDLESSSVMLSRRDEGAKDKHKLAIGDLSASLPKILNEIQDNYFNQAKKHRDENIVDTITSFDELKSFFTPKNPNQPEIHGGFVRAYWVEDPKVEQMLSEIKVTVRCIPFDQSGETGKCIFTGRESQTQVILAKSY